jgi:hypothetical protein
MQILNVIQKQQIFLCVDKMYIFEQILLSLVLWHIGSHHIIIIIISNIISIFNLTLRKSKLTLF